MATPMTPTQMLASLKAEGVKIQQWSGWRDRCRCHNGSHEKGAGPTGRPWGTMNGVMIHHTGSDSQADSYVRNVLASGYTGLPGPLCHSAGKMDGTVVLVGSGRANHAGGGDPSVLAKVRAESYSGGLTPRVGNSGGTDGNRHFYGIEVMYDGGQPMTAAQLDGAVRYAAAICRFHGWSAKSVIGHGEWSSDKWDPGKQSMTEFRSLVQARLDGSAPSNDPVPKPVDPIEEIMSYYKNRQDFEVRLSEIIAKHVGQKLDEKLVKDIPAPAYAEQPKGKTWHTKNVDSYTLDKAHFAHQNAYRANIQSAAVLAIVRELASKGGISKDDLAKIEDAAERGATDAINDKIVNADVTLEVKENQ